MVRGCLHLRDLGFGWRELDILQGIEEDVILGYVNRVLPHADLFNIVLAAMEIREQRDGKACLAN